MRRVVCLHGFTGSPESWDAVCAALPASVRVERPLILGHDPGGALASATFEAEVDRLARQLTGGPDGSDPIHLAGYSLGGRLALGLLVRHRHLFVSATLIGVSPGLVSESEREQRRRADDERAERLESEGLEAFLDAWESLPLFASQGRLPPPVLEAQRAIRRRHGAAGLARALRVLSPGRMPSYWSALPELDLPVHLMAGELDEKFHRLALDMARRLPRATVDVVPSAGHNLLLEAPERVADALTPSRARRGRSAPGPPPGG